MRNLVISITSILIMSLLLITYFNTRGIENAIEDENSNGIIQNEKAFKIKKPIVSFNWTPNWVETVHKGKFIEFPPYQKIIEIDPKTGINPNFTYVSDSLKNNWLKKACWRGLKSKYTLAYYILEEFNFDNEMISNLSKSVDYYKMSKKDTIDEWLRANSELWKNWITTAKERTSLWVQ